MSDRNSDDQQESGHRSQPEKDPRLDYLASRIDETGAGFTSDEIVARACDVVRGAANKQAQSMLTESEREFVHKYYPPGGKGVVAALEVALSRIRERSAVSDSRAPEDK